MIKQISLLLLILGVFQTLGQTIFTPEDQEEFFSYMQTTEEGRSFMKQVTERIIDKTNAFTMFSLGKTSKDNGGLTCDLCKVTVSGLDEVIRTKIVTSSLESFAELACEQMCPYNNITVCPGAVKEMGDVMVPSLANFLLSPDYVCSRLLNSCQDVEFEVLRHEDFVDRVLSGKPEFLKNNDFVDNLYKEIQKQENGPRKTIKAVHFSDVHVDFEYTPGTNANCNMPLCCRKENGYPSDQNDAAGYWGAYNCDTTPAALTKMFEFIRDEVKPDVVFWTGDMTPHNVWENSLEEVIEVNYKVSKQMQDILGEFMIYPLQGNHDVWPVNVQSFLDDNPIINNLTSHWNYWLNDEALKTFSYAGYYSQYLEIKGLNKKFPNVRVIGMTTQTCNPMNWYLWEVMSDPAGELAWLESVLKEMEENNEVAILLGHMPISDCLRAWGTRFQALAERYQHVIRFGLFGHSHDEKFFLTTSVNSENDLSKVKPISFNSILAPTTTYQGKNPSFAVYEIDEETMLMVDATTYFFNITKANAGAPEWEVYHNIREAYQIQDMSPSSFYEYSQRILNDEQEALKFDNFNAKGGPDAHRKSCDEQCRRGKYCDIATSTTDDEESCSQTSGSKRTQPYGFNKNSFQFTFNKDALFEAMSDPWLKKIDNKSQK